MAAYSHCFFWTFLLSGSSGWSPHITLVGISLSLYLGRNYGLYPPQVNES